MAMESRVQRAPGTRTTTRARARQFYISASPPLRRHSTTPTSGLCSGSSGALRDCSTGRIYSERRNISLRFAHLPPVSGARVLEHSAQRRERSVRRYCLVGSLARPRPVRQCRAASSRLSGRARMRVRASVCFYSSRHRAISTFRGSFTRSGDRETRSQITTSTLYHSDTIHFCFTQYHNHK